MPKIKYNERSWAIDLISSINIWCKDKQVLIKRAGGENTVSDNKKSLFPDVLLFGDEQSGKILQGWELKMPDTYINDSENIKNAKTKANMLGLNSFVIWNVSVAVLYKIKEDNSLIILHTWNDLDYIKTREDVLKNREAIENFLSSLLNDLNEFIVSGEIKTVSVIDVLSSEEISNFIQKNVGEYASNIEQKANKDNDLKNELNLWWRYAKKDYPDEENKFLVLARTNLLYLVNKFLLAHILKSYRSEANIVNEINAGISIIDGLRIFENLSKKIDFWNVFHILPFEENLTESVWNDLLDFNGFLKTLKFEVLDKEILHNLIEYTIYKNKRKFAGQFTTPTKLAEFLVRLSLKNASGYAYDPTCGSGTIARAIYYQKKKTLTPKEALETTWCSDKFALPLQLATFNMIDPEAMGEVINVFKEDATKIETGKEIKFRDPFNGNEVIKETPIFSLIASNLPFVQQEDIDVLNPDVGCINDFIKEKSGNNNLSLSGRTDLYGYLPFYLWKLLEDEGTLSLIISNSWLSTKWGFNFFKILKIFFKVKFIVTSGKGRWFNNAKVVTNILILEKKEPNQVNTEKIKFITTKKKIIEYSNEEIDEIVALSFLENSVDEEDIRVCSYLQEDMDNIEKLGLSLNSLFAENNWLTNFSRYLISISDLFDVARGERRGWDKMFYPEDDNNIESDYLRPVLKTSQSVKKLIAQPDKKAFCCELSKEELSSRGHTGVISWIEKFENMRNGTGVLLPQVLKRSGVNWYTMKPNTMADIVTNINFGSRLFFARFNEPTFVNQRLVRFTKKNDEVDIKLSHALLNSTLGLFYLEAMGIGRGEGALDLSSDKLKNDLKILNPELYSQEQKDLIKEKFISLENRNILDLENEVAKEDRKELDKAVLEPLGLLNYRDDIKKSLMDLYRIRMSVNK
ncbi:hypothetical protein A2996_00855 [Candidatus Campbellbacteria bacterium RIFCSPLOWO2_01_FULL_34_15]|uniref:DNA methylase adenine-specific domain-containing protein n=2 Tax=Candidatus Campbelliibacteriota TaxID=1752727 RepID=A0A1F5ENE9_9BACT|nr:MAG: hypothetical protein A2811_00680 [Candidatus Campbellbacteria bacterium RIFCSPHIGHO2_01_FULL_34_10]OGD68756.1 MAG: hypothetical protein A2996_00855 [Candidatus Campbellbacteria bacterium RIFCSPLOWO2_01_FULL_34_15]